MMKAQTEFQARKNQQRGPVGCLPESPALFG